MTLESEFLKFSTTKLDQLCGRIENCVATLTPEQFWSRGGDRQNAIGNLILHLTGNVRQWIVSGIGGAANTRDRDAEFAAREGADPGEMVEKLRAAVTEAEAVMSLLSGAQLLERISVQGYDVTKMEAIYHVVEHFAGHAFQIIFATKLITNRDLGFYAHLNNSSKTGEAIP